MTIRFDRYRVLAWVGDRPYTVALIRDPDRARAKYSTADRCAAAMYKNADTVTLVLERGAVSSLTVPGSQRELARRPLHESDAQGSDGQVESRGARRRHRRRRTVSAGRASRETAVA